MRYKFVKLYMLSLFLVFCAGSAFSGVPKMVTGSNNDGCSCQEWERLNSLGYGNFCGYGDFCSKSKNYYIGIKGFLNFINHGYYVDVGKTDSSVEFGQSFGGELNFGIALEGNWWLQVDLGHIGTYTDKKSFSDIMGLEFRESAYYLMADGVYMTSIGLYIGAGLGMVAHKTGLNLAGWQEQYSFSPMGQILFGLEQKLTQDWAIDFGTKLSAFYGTNQQFIGMFNMAIRTELIWNFALMVGIKYKF